MKKQTFCFTSEVIKDIINFLEDKPKNKDYKILIYNGNSFNDAISQSEYRVVKKIDSLNGENINISNKDKFVEVVTPEKLKKLSIVVSFD